MDVPENIIQLFDPRIGYYVTVDMNNLNEYTNGLLIYLAEINVPI